MTTELVELADEMRSVSGAFAEPALVEEWERRLRALASRAGGWRPIAEAPVSSDPMLGDVEDCLVYGPEIGRKMGRAWKYADGKVRAQAYGFHGDWKITHFQPLPEPPAAPRTGGGGVK